MMTANEARIMEKELKTKMAEELNARAKKFCDSLDEVIKNKVEKREHTAVIEVPSEIKYEIIKELEKNGYGSRVLNGLSIEIRW